MPTGPIYEHEDGDDLVAEQLVETEDGIFVEQLRRVEHGDFTYTLHDRDGRQVAEHKPGARISVGSYILHDDLRYCVVDHAPAGHRFTDPNFDGYALLADPG